jgi:hypothetical protein
MTNSGRSDCIDVAARFLAAEPGAVERAFEAHRRQSDGRCTGCRTRPVTWPCSTASIALAARALGLTDAADPG